MTLRQHGSCQDGLIHQAGTSAAVWNIGGVFIKVKAWRSEMQLEGDTIRFVNDLVPSLPTPTVLYSWVDAQWSRSFLILGPVIGRTLHQAWDTLSSCSRTELANTVARFCKALAISTSARLETVGGKGIVEPFLTAPPAIFEPSWKPQFLGPYSLEQLQPYLAETLATAAIAPFALYHADLGPRNILVNDDGNLIAIIDWESAAFYPIFWLGTKPLVSPGFLLPNGNRGAWANLLTKALEGQGFVSDIESYSTWKKMISEKTNSI